jgi:hypothetical protein
MFEKLLSAVTPHAARLCLRDAAVQRDTPPAGLATSF